MGAQDGEDPCAAPQQHMVLPTLLMHQEEWALDSTLL